MTTTTCPSCHGSGTEPSGTTHAGLAEQLACDECGPDCAADCGCRVDTGPGCPESVERAALGATNSPSGYPSDPQALKGPQNRAERDRYGLILTEPERALLDGISGTFPGTALVGIVDRLVGEVERLGGLRLVDAIAAQALAEEVDRSSWTITNDEEFEDALDQLPGALGMNAEGHVWLVWGDEQGDWWAVRPRGEDDPEGPEGDPFRPYGPLDLGQIEFPWRLFSWRDEPSAFERLRGSEDGVERVSDAEAERWAALADAATEGPWAIMGGGEYVSGIGTLVGVECAGGVRDVDAAFVAAARTAVPRLLVEREALRADHAALLALYEVEVARRESFEARVTRLTADLDAMEAEDSREDVRAKHWTEVLRVRRELAGVRGENNDAMEVIARGLGYSSSDFPLDRWPHLAMTGDHTSVSLAEEVVGRLGQACDFAARVEAENARLVDRIEQLSAEYEADLPESMAGDERLRRVFDDHANDVLGLLSDEDEGGE